jgi:RNA polymerase sigma factor (TIGR02999 family)
MADDVSALIENARGGDASAVQALFAHVYDELKVLARKQLADAGASTLNTTALVHEAYLKLTRSDARDLDSRAHFFALAAKAMRQIVIDHARARLTGKRGGGNAQWIDIESAAGISGNELAPDELLRLDRALCELGENEPRLAQLV